MDIAAPPPPVRTKPPPIGTEAEVDQNEEAGCLPVASPAVYGPEEVGIPGPPAKYSEGRHLKERHNDSPMGTACDGQDVFAAPLFGGGKLLPGAKDKKPPLKQGQHDVSPPPSVANIMGRADPISGLVGVNLAEAMRMDQILPRGDRPCANAARARRYGRHRGR